MATVGDVMTTDILTVPSTATLGEVARRLRARNVGSAVVVDDAEQPLGIITDRELVDSVAASRNPDQGQAGSWMRPEMWSVDRGSSLEEASRVQLMRQWLDVSIAEKQSIDLAREELYSLREATRAAEREAQVLEFSADGNEIFDQFSAHQDVFASDDGFAKAHPKGSPANCAQCHQ